mgnify:CR=1 FL=1
MNTGVFKTVLVFETHAKNSYEASQFWMYQASGYKNQDQKIYQKRLKYACDLQEQAAYWYAQVRKLKGIST